MGYSVYVYPWNWPLRQPDEKVDELLRAGLRSINIATSYHAGKFIHPRGPHRVYFPEDGVVYFRPRLNYGRVRPVPGGMLDRGDVLARLAARADLGVNAWTVLLHNTRLGLLHPDITVRNAFGNSYVYSLCPAHPEVRRYALTLCRDLAGHYPVEALLLETPGYLAYNHGYHHEFAQIRPDPGLEAWLGFCFCEHCIAGADRAGIDGKSLRRYVKQAIDHCLDGDLPHPETPPQRPENGVFENAEMSAFAGWRCAVVTSLVEEIRAEVPSSVKVRVISTTQTSHAGSFLEGHDLPALHDATEGLELPLYQASAAAAIAEANWVIGRTGKTDCLGAILRPGWPDMRSREQLADTVAGIRALGIRDLAFYHYDMLPSVNVQWLRQVLQSQPGEGAGDGS
jgi:hypothetical protein